MKKEHMLVNDYLTTEALDAAYASWGEANRDYFDIRFGQSIHNRFSHVPDVAFFTEDKHQAYQELRQALAYYQR